MKLFTLFITLIAVCVQLSLVQGECDVPPADVVCKNFRDKNQKRVCKEGYKIPKKNGWKHALQKSCDWTCKKVGNRKTTWKKACMHGCETVGFKLQKCSKQEAKEKTPSPPPPPAQRELKKEEKVVFKGFNPGPPVVKPKEEASAPPTPPEEVTKTDISENAAVEEPSASPPPPPLPETPEVQPPPPPLPVATETSAPSAMEDSNAKVEL